MLELVAVTKVFGSREAEVVAISEVSLQVAAGEFVAITGPSGCGKSTLLHLAGGMDQPSGGRVRVAGEDLAELSLAALARVRRKRVGYVFQRLNLVPSLTALENVMLPLELDGIRPKEARDAAGRALELVELPEPWGRFPDELSGGQQQRIAIARAIVGERSLLLADEPTGALDVASGDAIVDLLASLCVQARTAVVLVTHEPRYASWADRVVFLRDGAVVDQAHAPKEAVAP